jgi:hypothetical protein
MGFPVSVWVRDCHVTGQTSCERGQTGKILFLAGYKDSCHWLMIEGRAGHRVVDLAGLSIGVYEVHATLRVRDHTTKWELSLF